MSAVFLDLPICFWARCLDSRAVRWFQFVTFCPFWCNIDDVPRACLILQILLASGAITTADNKFLAYLGVCVVDSSCVLLAQSMCWMRATWKTQRIRSGHSDSVLFSLTLAAAVKCGLQQTCSQLVASGTRWKLVIAHVASCCVLINSFLGEHVLRHSSN